MALCKHLLAAYPHLKRELIDASKRDIPPAYRGEIWSRLLDVGGRDEIAERYADIDKETPTHADRQMSVDIPRCHSYSKIMSSPAAHKKLRRVLKAWLNSHPHLTYWQGLDSLCAVFVYWNFDDEARAFFSFSNFIDKYMYGLFRKINADVLNEYLCVFTNLLGFHDPELSVHMARIEFNADLYAISWVLTMFAHVFPLHKIAHLWDTLLLGNSSFPLCVAVAILIELRSQILPVDFTGCIRIFNELPQIDMDFVMTKSISIFCHTPRSCTMRRHAGDLKQRSDDAAARLREQLPSVAELKRFSCLQISSHDLIELCRLGGGGGSVKKPTKAVICVVDVRSRDEFQRGCVPGSVNLPYTPPLADEAAATSGGKAPQFPPGGPFDLVIVVGYSKSPAHEDHAYARLLVHDAGMKGVCVLRGGIDVLKPVGVLTVPSLKK